MTTSLSSCEIQPRKKCKFCASAPSTLTSVRVDQLFDVDVIVRRASDISHSYSLSGAETLVSLAECSFPRQSPEKSVYQYSRCCVSILIGARFLLRHRDIVAVCRKTLWDL